MQSNINLIVPSWRFKKNHQQDVNVNLWTSRGIISSIGCARLYLTNYPSVLVLAGRSGLTQLHIWQCAIIAAKA
ncbi:MAG TPA: hypothetical protein DCE81_11200 [Cytophagales bacterium]|nr:hypothetical protein [Cytophagales bacterium]